MLEGHVETKRAGPGGRWVGDEAEVAAGEEVQIALVGALPKKRPVLHLAEASLPYQILQPMGAYFALLRRHIPTAQSTNTNIPSCHAIPSATRGERAAVARPPRVAMAEPDNPAIFTPKLISRCP